MKRRDTAALQRVINFLYLIPAMNDPDVHDDVRAVLQAEIDRRKPPVPRFVWERPDRFVVDGRPVHHVGKGLPLAFMVFAAHQAGMEPFPASVFFPGKRAQASATQSLDYAASALPARHFQLARAIARIGTSKGLVLVKRQGPDVDCSSPWMVEFSRRAHALGYRD